MGIVPVGFRPRVSNHLSWIGNKRCRKLKSVEDHEGAGRVVATYGLIVLHEGQQDWANSVEARIRAVCSQVIQRADLVGSMHSVRELQDHPEVHAVVIYLATPAASDSARIADELALARREALAVVPMVMPNAQLERVIPDVLRRLNAVIWEEASPGLTLHVLRTFGLLEAERRLFLSYRRAESASLALQLRDALSRRGYDVFLDRFSVPPGADFQKRIDNELSDKAFVLLLESQSAVDSPWVQHEVTYALSHHIAVLSLTMPDVGSGGVFEAVDEALRYRLRTKDFDTRRDFEGRLTEDSLTAVLDTVEIISARQLRRKRAGLLGAMRDWLFQAGFAWEPLAEWALLAVRDGAPPKVLMVSARPPTARDLREVDLLRREINGASGTLVHDTIDQDPDSRELIEWIMSDRPLATLPLARLPDALGI